MHKILDKQNPLTRLRSPLVRNQQKIFKDIYFNYETRRLKFANIHKTVKLSNERKVVYFQL